MKNSILIAAIAALAIISCKKDKPTDQPKLKPPLSAKQSLLIGKDWKIKSVVYDGTDITQMIPACMMDNTMYHFTDATKGYFDEGATKCETADPQRGNFTWKLANNETRIIVTTPESKDTFDLLNVTVSELKLGIDEELITLKN